MLNLKTYLNNRGISDEVIADAKIHMQGNTIVIPVMDKDKNILFNKYRKDPNNTDDKVPKYTYQTGAKSTLYNIHTITRPEDDLYICEGELDALMLQSLGLQAISSTGGASTFMKEWAEEIKKIHNGLVLIIYDRDIAGVNGSLKVNKMIPDAEIVFLPEFKGKDVTDFIQANKSFTKIIHSNWCISDPDPNKGLQSQVNIYNNVANKAKDVGIKYPEYKLYTDQIIKVALETREKLKYMKRREVKKEYSNDKLKNAKLFPIRNLLEFSQANFAVCPFHNERTGSLKYYPKTNSTYCFGGCGKHYDAIDIAAKIHNLSIKDAINYLNNDAK